MANPVALITLALSSFVPLIKKLLRGEKTEEYAKKIVDVAETITGHKDYDKIIRSFAENAKMVKELELEVRKLEYEYEKICAEDRLSARKRDTDLLYATKGINWRANIMMIIALFGVIGCVVLLSLGQDYLREESIGVIATIAGVFCSCLKDAYTFEFGSSNDARSQNDKTIQELAKLGNLFVMRDSRNKSSTPQHFRKK